MSGADLAQLPVAILAGGLGTRLRSAIGDRPKVIAEVAGRPFLARVLDQLAGAGFRDVVLCTGYGADLVSTTLGVDHGPLRIRYSREAAPLGTGGALRLALPLLRGDAALVMNGDSYCEVDFAAAWAWHRAQRAPATLVLVDVPDTERYGRVEVDQHGVIGRFTEKQEGKGPGWISAGIYILERSCMAEIPAGRACSLERDLFPAWVGRGLRGWRAQGRFLDIGTPRSYAAAERFFEPGS